MGYFTCVLAPPLSDFVALLWFYEHSGQPHAKERLLPTGTVELVVNLREDETRLYDGRDARQIRRFPGTIVCGPHSQSFVIDTAEQTSVVGVHFKPGGAFPFLGLPAGELRNQHAPLDVLWGLGASELRERLLEAATPANKLHILADALLEHSKRPLIRHPAVRYALGAFDAQNSVAQVTERTGMSAKRFIERFDDEVGLTPKLYCRVQRFQRALRSIGNGAPVDWEHVALDCGYFDQAHFINDFRDFSGFTPTGYLRQRSEHLNHVPLPD